MRPEIPEETVCRVDEYVKSQYGVDPEAMKFAERLRLVLNDTESDTSDDETAALEGVSVNQLLQRSSGIDSNYFG